jgi:hypothetical protein
MGLPRMTPSATNPQWVQTMPSNPRPRRSARSARPPGLGGEVDLRAQGDSDAGGQVLLVGDVRVAVDHNGPATAWRRATSVSGRPNGFPEPISCPPGTMATMS